MCKAGASTLVKRDSEAFHTTLHSTLSITYFETYLYINEEPQVWCWNFNRFV